MNTNVTAVKRGRGRPPMSEEEKMESGKFTTYLGVDLGQAVKALSERQHIEVSKLIRQAVAEHVARFQIAA
ncbi:hypothetical protein SBF1_830015 [Candidatus Desulfosporosinus infrequens]|uniref:Predicted DNA-binding protein ribbon-helix-helix domain-containing protein n=1 Tax=Candidatus Desulfosporosinus infrequens TaxID=2043169 RepID=A0A2U3LUD6_9FIRM|nr:hypothetical protein SBF1_830015 [Candidatus Desulfosporosinus infrequens]